MVLAALVVGAGWLWLRPKAHVALPGPSATPGQVVRAYVNALDARDFATSNAMTSAHLDIHNHWWSRPGTIDDLHVSRAHLIGHLSLAYRDSLASVEDDRYAADVDTSVVFHGGDWPQGRQPWSFLLVRQHKDQPWTVLDMGQG